MRKFVITNVDKNENGEITHVQVDNTPIKYTKQQIITSLLSGTIYVIPSSAPVRIVDNKYLRADRNEDIKEDNLGVLPPCVTFGDQCGEGRSLNSRSPWTRGKR